MDTIGCLRVVLTTALLLLPGINGFLSVVPRCAISSRPGVALHSAATSDDVRSAEAAKSNLRSALAESGGSTLAEGVGAAVEVRVGGDFRACSFMDPTCFAVQQSGLLVVSRMVPTGRWYAKHELQGHSVKRPHSG